MEYLDNRVRAQWRACSKLTGDWESCPAARHGSPCAWPSLCASLRASCLLLPEPRGQLLLEDGRLHALAVPLEHLPVAPDDEFCEVPLDLAIGRSPEVSAAKTLVDGVGLRTPGKSRARAAGADALS